MIWITALLVWTLLMWGLTYTAVRAELLTIPRIAIIMLAGRRIGPPLSWLLSCFSCCSFWTGQAAACIVMAHLTVPWYIWIYGPPIAGFCAVGLVDMMAFLRRNSNCCGGSNEQIPTKPTPTSPESVSDGGNTNA